MNNVYPDIEHINSMTYDKGSKVGVRPEKAKDTYDFILESMCLVDITKPLERTHHDSENR